MHIYIERERYYTHNLLYTRARFVGYILAYGSWKLVGRHGKATLTMHGYNHMIIRHSALIRHQTLHFIRHVYGISMCSRGASEAIIFAGYAQSTTIIIIMMFVIIIVIIMNCLPAWRAAQVGAGVPVSLERQPTTNAPKT